MLSNFFSSSIEQKRLAWNGIAKHLHEAFDSSMFNIHGYIQEFWKKQKSTDEIFDAMEANWKEASNQRKDQMIKQVLSKSKKSYPVVIRTSRRNRGRLVSFTNTLN